MLNPEIIIQAQQILRIANEAVAAARRDNIKHKLAHPISLNGKPYYQLLDGTLTDKNPNK